MPEFRDGKIAKCVLEQSERRYQFNHARDADDIDLWHRGLYVGLFFRGFSCSNNVTKRTWMGTIKCLSDCLAQGPALRILDKHIRPGERLECDPMQPNRAAKRADCSNAADLAKHVCEARSRKFYVNHSFVPFFAANAPF